MKHSLLKSMFPFDQFPVVEDQMKEKHVFDIVVRIINTFRDGQLAFELVLICYMYLVHFQSEWYRFIQSQNAQK